MSTSTKIALSVIILSSSAWAGAFIDLRPNPPQPPEGYAPCSVISVEVFLVDTGNPQGDIAFRSVFLDFEDSTDAFSYPGADQQVGTEDDEQFSWINPFQLGTASPLLPFTSLVFTGVPIPGITLTLPNEGEVRVGHVSVVAESPTGVLDVRNMSEVDPERGAYIIFGIGAFPDDPVTVWRASTGELTGGTLTIEVMSPVIANFDDDVDVDLLDFEYFHDNLCNWECQGEMCSCHPPNDPDIETDFNSDHSVDLLDVAIFQEVFTGPCSGEM